MGEGLALFAHVRFEPPPQGLRLIDIVNRALGIGAMRIPIPVTGLPRRERDRKAEMLLAISAAFFTGATLSGRQNARHARLAQHLAAAVAVELADVTCGRAAAT